MCGICGFAGFNDDILLEKMCSILVHRGPDDSGRYVDRANSVSLGHRRLSIIDLEGGRQPICNETGKVVVVFNGEIYNFLELKKELEEKGHLFKTHSDTEVLVHLYEEHGLDMPNCLNGIFSFVILDQEKKRVFGVRDNFGVKPLFYHYRNNRLLFASEVKALLLDDQVAAGINYEALHYTLNLRFIPGAQSLFKDIYRIPAGHYFLFDLNSSKMSVNRYWNKRYAVNKKMTEDEAVEGIRFHLRQAVKRQMISDVPLGAYLSGGLDSSAIVAFASEFRSGLSTFSMGFDEPTDEVGDARRVSDHFRTDFHETFIKMDPLESLKEVIWYVEEPKVNILQGYYLSQFARQHVKVALSGLGGDELFAGYVNNKFLHPLQSLHTLGRQGGIRSLLSRALFWGENKLGDLRFDEVRRGLQIALAYGDKTRFYLILRNVWDYDDGFYDNVYSPEMKVEMMKYRTGRLFEPFFSGIEDTILGQSLTAEFNTKMVDDFLLNEDRTSMAHSLEVRVPFLDKNLVEFAFSIPTRLKIKNNSTKYIYKKAMKGILPDFVLTKKKWGFAINPYHQFKKDLKKIAMEVLNERKIKSQGILNWNYINKIINHPVSPRLRWHYYYLWQLIGFQYWHETFIENKIKVGETHVR